MDPQELVAALLGLFDLILLWYSPFPPVWNGNIYSTPFPFPEAEYSTSTDEPLEIPKSYALP
jgi:hypothetical protein